LSEFNREIGFYKSHFKDFYKKQSLVVRKKIDWTLLLIKLTKIIPEKYLKHLTNTNGLCEVQGNLVVLLSGFQKKTQKTPKKELKKAERLKKEYYENK